MSRHHHHHHNHHRVGGGAAVLDIGGDIGALVATMDVEWAGAELFLRPDGDPDTTVHTGVWHRHEGGETQTVAVFPELPCGTYRVLNHDGEVIRTVDVVGGAVATVDLRAELRG